MFSSACSSSVWSLFQCVLYSGAKLLTLRENMGMKQRVMRRAEDSKYWHILGACIHAEHKHEDRAVKKKKHLEKMHLCLFNFYILPHAFKGSDNCTTNAGRECTDVLLIQCKWLLKEGLKTAATTTNKHNPIVVTGKIFPIKIKQNLKAESVQLYHCLKGHISHSLILWAQCARCWCDQWIKRICSVSSVTTTE